MKWWAITLGMGLLGCEAWAPLDVAPGPSRPETAPGAVIDALSDVPIAGARVALVGTSHATDTDAEGRFTLPRAAGFDRLRVTAPGYIGAEIRRDTDGAVELWPTEAPDDEIRAVLRARAPRDRDDPDDPDLTPRARALLLGEPETPRLRPGALGVRRQALIVPPATVRVYRRGAENDSCQGRVDVIPLEEYTRGVVPHEWIPSWHLESLKAGAVAARTYAWNWVLAGGKYDCADVDDTTRCQVYRDDRNDAADEAVAATAGQGIQRDGAIISSEYSAENGDPTEFGVSEPLCTGRARQGHGRGMCQWGTQRWATQRDMTYDWMVEHYYPGGSVSMPGAQRPRLELSQGITRTQPQACPDPAGTFDCADFVPDGRSWGLFDLYVGQRVELALRVKNAGGGPTAAEGDRSSVTLAVDLPEGLLAAVAARIESDAPANDGQSFRPHAAGDDPRNPAADAPGGPALRFRLHELVAGETRRVVLTLRGEAYSVPTGGPARVRTWIASMADYYEKPAWDQAAVQNEGQTFNGGDLRLQTEFDVFDPARWTFDGGDDELVEGWRARGGVGPLRVDPGAGALIVSVAGADPGVVSPFTHLDADRLGQLRIRANPTVEGQIYWRGPGEDFSEQRSVSATLGGAPVPLAGEPGWTGEVLQLRVDFADGAGELAIDEIAAEPLTPVVPDRDAAPTPSDGGPRPTDAGPPAGGPDAGRPATGDAGRVPTPPVGGAAPPESSARVQEVQHDGGCGAAPPGAPAPWLALALLAALRRRRVPAKSPRPAVSRQPSVFSSAKSRVLAEG